MTTAVIMEIAVNAKRRAKEIHWPVRKRNDGSANKEEKVLAGILV